MQKYRFMSVLIATLFSISIFAAPKLDVTVQMENDFVNGGDVNATVTFTNNGKGTQKLLQWYTKLDEQHIFEVTRNGVNVPYQGPHFKRHAPTEKDFIKLKKGQSISFDYELSSYYDMSVTGVYQVSYEAHSAQLHGPTAKNNKRQVEILRSNPSSVFIDGLVFAKPGNGNGGGKPGGDDGNTGDCVGDICFTGRCSNSQKSDILSAHSAADSITNNSVAYLNSNSASNVGQRYRSWFGNPTSSRYNLAKANFNAINDAIDNQQITYDCSCKRNYFAYVYPAQPYDVYLCKSFWNANELGTDSRAGTIVHELSHFNAVAGTDDVVYGQSGARNLANSNPDSALNNADSHEYFAENTPAEN